MLNKISRRYVFRYAIALIVTGVGNSSTFAKALADALEVSRSKRSGIGSDDYLDLTITELTSAISNNEISAERYAQAVVDRAKVLAHLNAFISFKEDIFLESARQADKRSALVRKTGPLHGVPLAIKDNIACQGYPLTGGTPTLRNYFPERNAAIVQSLMDAGAIVAGKSNLHELGMGEIGTNAYFGRTKNPYSPKLVTGGSSGGTAAAVAARIVPGGLGTDTGGSVRVPASLCGLVGLRPSVGRYPRDGIIPMSVTRDTAGPMARSVSDVALLDDVITGDIEGESRLLTSAGLAGLRLGIPRKYFYENLNAEVYTAVEVVLGRLEEYGVILVEESIPMVTELHDEISFPIILYEMARELTRYIENNVGGLTMDQLVEGIESADVRALTPIWYGENAVSENTYTWAVKERLPVFRKTYSDYFAQHGIDAVLFPATAQPARILNDDWSLRIDEKSSISTRIYGQNVGPGSLAGIPGITLPIALNKMGLPIGLGMDGPYGSDLKLLGIAAGIESIIPRLPSPDIVT